MYTANDYGRITRGRRWGSIAIHLEKVNLQ